MNPAHTQPAWAAPVHDLAAARADQPLYELLYQVTRPYTAARIAQQLRDMTAQSAADLAVDPLQQLRAFLETDDAEGGSAACAVAETDAAAVDAARADLAAHLASAGARGPKRGRPATEPDAALVDELAEELAMALWSTVLDHAARQCDGQGRVRADMLVPTWPGLPESLRLNEALRTDLQHFGLALPDLVEIAHQAFGELARRAPRDGRLQLPQRLHLPQQELAAFLAAHPRPGLAGALARRAAPAVGVTSQLAGW